MPRYNQQRDTVLTLPKETPENVLTALNALTEQLKENNMIMSRLSLELKRAIHVKTKGYRHHRFTTFSYGVAPDITSQDKVNDLGFQNRADSPEQIILSPTTDVQVDFDNSAITNSTASIYGSKNQTATFSLHWDTILVQGVSAAGTMNIFGFWD